MGSQRKRFPPIPILTPWRVVGAVWLLISWFLLLLGVLQGYTWFRKTYFLPERDAAFANALSILRWEQALRLDFELALQRWVLQYPALITFFNEYYRQFKPVLYLSAALALLLNRDGFRRVWRLFLVTTLIALPMYAVYPLAPPRFMQPYGFPFVDTLAAYSETPNATSGVNAANQYAAMPSMHIGWTTICMLWLAVALPWRRIGLVIGAAHLGVMCITVMATGNHYWLDIAGGFATVGAAWLVLSMLPARLPRLVRRMSLSRTPG